MSEQMFDECVTTIKNSNTIIINCKNINEDMSTNNFAIEFDKLSKYLMGFAYKLTQDVHQAEDLFQDTALRAFRYREKLAADSNLRAWLSTIMKNIFINNFRAQKRRGKVFDHSVEDFLLYQDRLSASNEGDMNLAMNDVVGLIHQLDEKYSIPILMLHQGYKYEEICQRLDMPLGTVKSRIYIARKMLKSKIKNLNYLPAVQAS